MTLTLRRIGGGMVESVAGCVMVGSAVVLWDVVTYSLFNPLFSLHQGRWQQPNAFLWWLSGVLLTGFWPAWALWSAAIGANVAGLRWRKLGKYRSAAAFAIGFGPALGTILEGGSLVSGGPMILLVPLWLLIMGLDTCAAWGVAWCIVALTKRAKLAKKGMGELRPLLGFPVIGAAAGFAVIFAGGQEVLDNFKHELPELQGTYQHIARLDRARAQREFSRTIWQMVPKLLRHSIQMDVLPRLLPERWCWFLMPRE